MSINSNSRKNLILSFVVSLILLLLSMFLFSPILKTVILAGTLALVLTPPYRFLVKLLWGDAAGPKKQILAAIVFTFLALFLIVLVLGSAAGIVIGDFDLLQEFVEKVAAFIQKWMGKLMASGFDLQQAVSVHAQQLLSYLQDIFVVAASLVVRLVVFVTTLYFLLRHGGEFVEKFRRTLSESHRSLFNRFARTTYSVLYAIYVVHLGTTVITFLLALPFFLLIGFTKHILFWSLLCGVFQLIPIVGPSFIMFAISAYTFSIGDPTAGILCLVVGYPIVSMLPDLVFRPLMMWKQARINPLLMLLGFFGGMLSMGIIGFVLGPLALSLLSEALRFVLEQMRIRASSVTSGDS